MSDYSSYSSSLVASEGTLTILPKNWKGDGTVPGVIFCHGHGGNERECFGLTGANRNMFDLITEVVEAGFPVLSCYFGGNIWGNDTAIADVTAAKTYLQSTVGAKAGKVAFVAQSMGHLTAMNWVAQNLASTSCVVGSMGVCDLSDIALNPTYTSSVTAAYGHTYSDSTDGTAHNPTKMAQAGKYAGLPWYYVNGTSDTTCPPATGDTLASLIGATATRRKVAGGHAWDTVGNYDYDEIVSFIRQYNV